jgi:hypothetical protein
MPYKIIKLKLGRFKVVNKKNGRVHAYHTTKKKAEAQLRLLNSIEKK